jgi:FAD/FMN-containing dehydrogenase
VRKQGLTIDDLLAAEIVTADGRRLYVDAGSHPDLFWAIRGGGGNFGVVTRFKFRLHDVDRILGGTLMLPATPEIIASFVAEAEAAPEELSIIASVMKAPPLPSLPTAAHGKLVIIARMVHAGDAGGGERAIAPFRRLAKPVADMVKPMRYAQLYEPDAGRHPVVSIRTMFVDAIDEAAAQTIIDRLETSTARMAAAEIRVLGGAMARVSSDATAFAHRGSRIMMNIAAMYERADEAVVHEPWVDTVAAALRQSDGGAYVGFLRDEGVARVREAYAGSWARLVAVKKRYDPDNLFRLNHNIPPR